MAPFFKNKNGNEKQKREKKKKSTPRRKEKRYGSGFYTESDPSGYQDYTKVSNKGVEIEAPKRNQQKMITTTRAVNVDTLKEQYKQNKTENPSNLKFVNQLYHKIKWLEQYKISKWIINNPVVSANIAGATLIGLGIFHMLTREGTGEIARTKLKDALTLEETKKSASIEAYWGKHIEKQLEIDLKQYNDQVSINKNVTNTSQESFDPREYIKQQNEQL
mmetsp:Transcript_13694/g.20747  ORF Transcript_13694/g.20747 Transcript_13694/m.20747 type:complete len:219 (+) Transcript_13694:97-753(+)